MGWVALALGQGIPVRLAELVFVKPLESLSIHPFKDSIDCLAVKNATWSRPSTVSSFRCPSKDVIPQKQYRITLLEVGSSNQFLSELFCFFRIMTSELAKSIFYRAVFMTIDSIPQQVDNWNKTCAKIIDYRFLVAYTDDFFVTIPFK